MNAEVNLIIKTDLACLLESFFYSGNQHSFVIAFRASVGFLSGRSSPPVTDSGAANE